MTVALLADGRDTGKTLTLSESSGWTGSFRELDKYSQGREIQYTVAETQVEGYESAVSGSQTEGYVITNRHIRSAGQYTAHKSSDREDQEVKPGDRITYTIAVKNTGETKLVGLWIRDFVPAYTTFVSAGQGGTRGAIDGKQHVDWFVSALEVGETASVTFTVEVNACVPENTTIVNVAHTEDTEHPEQPPLNTPENPKDRTNEVKNPVKEPVQSSVPKTGDDSGLYVYLMIMIASGTAMAVLLANRQFRRKG